MLTPQPPVLLRRIVKIAVTVILLIDAVYIGIHYYPPFRITLLYASGRNHGCSLSRALESHSQVKQQFDGRDQIFNASQQIETSPEGLALWKTPKGQYWIPKGCERVLAHNLAEQARKIYAAGTVGVKRGDVVLDCGANVGVFTREALNAGAKLVVSIEPAPDNIECLRRNFASEIAAGRVIVVPKGVWDKEDVLQLHVFPNNSARDSFVVEWKEATQTVQAPLTTIDKLAADLHLNEVNFIKMDIEGAEKRALAGARGVLAKYKPQMAIAAEHLADDGENIPLTVHNIAPSYKFECGPCLDFGSGVTPDVLYFR
jgi:FkbM family methyltransferase